MTRPCVGLALLLLAGAGGARAEEKKPVPLYTNEDLERVSPYRDQTGVGSTVDVPSDPLPARAGDEGRARGEAYWRRQAESVRARLFKARERIEELRARIAEREAQPARRARRTPGPAADLQLESWRRQLSLLEARVREAEARFEDRARREGALPGWLR